MFVWAIALILVGCRNPLGIDDATWKTMTPEQRLDAARRQAELDAAAAKAREERLKAAQAEEDAKLRELYAGKSTPSYLFAPVPYAPLPQTGQPNLIHVTITDAVRELTKGKPDQVQIPSFVMAPCEVKQIRTYPSRSWWDYVVWVAYIPPAFYWDVKPSKDKEDLQRYASCDGNQLVKESYYRPNIIPISSSPVRVDVDKERKFRVSSFTITFTNANSPVPLAQ
jgi:hypothetical protein